MQFMKKEGLIISYLQDIKQDVTAVKQEVADLKQDVAILKQDVVKLEQRLNEKIDSVEQRLNDKIDSVEMALDTEIDSVYHIALENKRNIELLLIPFKGRSQGKGKRKLQSALI